MTDDAADNTVAGLDEMERGARTMLKQVADAERQVDREGATLDRETALRALRACHECLSKTIALTRAFKRTTEQVQALQRQAVEAVALNAEFATALALANHTAQTAIALVDPAMRQKPN